MRQAADHGAADPNSHADHNVAGDAEHLVNEHEPPGQPKDERHQRPDQAGRHWAGR